jgi:hypothetical protein
LATEDGINKGCGGKVITGGDESEMEMREKE